MKKALIFGTVLLALGATPALAESGKPRLIACYQKVEVPAQYEVTKVKIKDAVRKYLKRNGRIELVEYPAVYREDRKEVKAAHVVMREIPCK